MTKVIFTGLTPEDYMHPEEKNFRIKAGNLPLVQEGLNLLNDVSVQLVRQITEGKWVELKPTTAPEIFAILDETCTVLNFPRKPKIFTRHERSLKTIAGGTDHMQLLIPDYILEEYDPQMKSYLLGNAITMFKSGHVQLATINSVLCANTLTAAIQLALLTYLRAADLSSDRGGLLSCQNFAAAAKCILAETGLPISELRYLSDDEVFSLTEEYLREVSYGSGGDWLTDLSAFFKRVTQAEALPALRLKELFDWYNDGYQEILRKGVA